MNNIRKKYLFHFLYILPFILPSCNFIPIITPESGDEGGNGQGVHDIPSTDNLLVVDLHSFMPSDSSSADVSTITCTKDIAEEFKEKTGITIKWFTGKNTAGETEEVSEDFIKAIQNGTMPAIGFSWSRFIDRGYYMDITNWLDTPNEFLSAEDAQLYPTWKSQFPDYLFSTKEIANQNGNIIAVPILLDPGPSTGWFYNPNNFRAGTPTTWNEFRDAAIDVRSNDAGPFPYKKTSAINNWEMQFSIGPSFAYALREINDYDLDGKVTEAETLQGVLDGHFSPLESENPHHYQTVRAAYYMLKDFYRKILPSNWKSADPTEKWDKNGNDVALRQNGLWAIRAESNKDGVKRPWKYGCFATPVVSQDSATWLEDNGFSDIVDLLPDEEPISLDVTDVNSLTSITPAFVDMYKPKASLFLNLMYHGIYQNKKVEENAIKFLKYLTTPDCLNRIISEHGGVLGGAKGCAAPSNLYNVKEKTGWLTQKFPVVPDYTWPDAYVLANNIRINTQFTVWCSSNSASDDETFFNELAKEQLAGANAYKKSIEG